MQQVRTFHKHAPANMPQDNHRTAHGRVQLKLAALAYEGSTRRCNQGDPFEQAGVGALCHAAIRYVAALEGISKITAHDPGLPFTDDRRKVEQNRIAAARLQLQLGALAYEGSRHGADGGIGFARAGMAMLCQQAIRYVESLENTSKAHLYERVNAGGDDV